MDNRGNSRANTCYQAQLLEELYLLDNRPIFLVSIVVNHSNLSDRHFLVRQTIQVSAPSAFDGSVLDYHGIHG